MAGDIEANPGPSPLCESFNPRQEINAKLLRLKNFASNYTESTAETRRSDRADTISFKTHPRSHRDLVTRGYIRHRSAHPGLQHIPQRPKQKWWRSVYLVETPQTPNSQEDPRTQDNHKEQVWIDIVQHHTKNDRIGAFYRPEYIPPNFMFEDIDQMSLKNGDTMIIGEMNINCPTYKSIKQIHVNTFQSAENKVMRYILNLDSRQRTAMETSH